jgi:diadenosine tetraphosphate (Ap4A) HIT family hydrolase
VFCAIVAGRAPASIVYRDRATVAFMDLNPVPVHVLVIPTAHRAQVWELDAAESAAVYRRLPALAAAGRPCSTSTSTSCPCMRATLCSNGTGAA